MMGLQYLFIKNNIWNMILKSNSKKLIFEKNSLLGMAYNYGCKINLTQTLLVQ